mgnify:CR=1 FL=1
MPSLKERLACAMEKARQPGRPCLSRDQEECDRLIVEAERSAWEMVAWGSVEIDRSFCWAHYDSRCEDGTGPESGSLSLHSLTDFDPKRLKGVARMLYERLRSEEFGFTVVPVFYTGPVADTFRFRISWAR